MTPKQTEMKTGTVCFGDCLEHLKQWNRWNQNAFELQPSLADLIYLDPPWNSKANYNILFGEGQASADDSQTAQETAFTDMWQWNPEADRRVKLICGDIFHDDYHHHPAFKSILALKTLIGKSGMLAYLSYMAERLALIRMILKETGSIYLHCDPTASHYLKMIMDDIFGAENFRNEIVWHYSAGHSPRKDFKRKHDIIFRYVKDSNKFNFNQPRMPYFFRSEKEKDREFKFRDESGRLYRQNRTKNKHGNPKRFYFDEGTPVDTVWSYLREKEINSLGATSKERQYPTQKPLALLKRIIQASTDEGDVVLDPFCGCGTAVVAAHQLKRKFVGVDISLFAVETVAYNRLLNEAKMPEKDIRVLGIPMDLSQARRLAKDDPFAFEIFAVEACIPGMVANKSQRRDKGIDGKGWLLYPVTEENGKKKSLILAQVKAGKPTLSHVRDFAHVISSTEGVVAGVFITVEKAEKGHWTDGMREVAAQLGTFKHEHSMEEFERLQHWHIGQFFYKSARQRLPHLPELSDPHKKEKVPIRQTGFLTKQYGR